MLDRVFKLSSNWSLFNKNCIRLKTLFLQLVYPGHLIYSMISSFIASKQTSAPPRKSTSDLSAISHSRPQSLRSFWPAAGIESSGSNHFGHAPQMKTELNRMGRIQLFPLLFQNGCSQSSRFQPQARRIVGSGDENGNQYELFYRSRNKNQLTLCENSCLEGS